MNVIKSAGMLQVIRVQMELSSQEKKTPVIINPKDEFQGTNGKSFTEILKEKMVMDSLN